jgi:diguanylate cyclase (GGDEF)-like protein
MTNKLNILYVDDESDIRMIVEYALEDEADFNLLLCSSGQEALAKVVEFKPDLILLDVMMPGQDGPSTLQKLRELPQTRATPVLFVTAKVQPHEVAQFKAMGAIDVIAKPFEPTQLAAHIRQHISSGPRETKEDKKRKKFETLRELYRQELPSRLEAIANNWQTLQTAHADTDVLKELHRQVHSLTGSGHSFGYSTLSDAARGIEHTLARLLDGSATFDADLTGQISRQLAELDNIVKRGPDSQLSLAATTHTQPTAGTGKLVYIIEDDQVLAEQIKTQLQMTGWTAAVFGDATSAKTALSERLPAAVIVDLFLPEGKFAGIKLLQKFKELDAQKIPRILISSQWNWESRLAAARAGADAYLRKPFDLPVLLDQLEKLTNSKKQETYRVLIVEDTVSLANYYAQVLEDAGMQTRIVTEPSTLLDALATFHPELILMDIYMPGCSGIEAAQVIRQDSKFISVPIVFLSSEVEKNRQLGALQTGADDFLEKTISDSDLIRTVSLRAERFRDLSTVIRQDSLTGLLNHVSFKMQLESEYARAQRAGADLTFAMIDIDHFKSINDNYGHPSGDRVLKCIAQMLMMRLRKSDVIGRYGGEEFAIFMPDTSLEQAVKVLDGIREHFAMIRYVHEQTEFSCTLSAGVSCAPPFCSINEVIKAADNALYSAKQSGRNRVCVAPPLPIAKPTVHKG